MKVIVKPSRSNTLAQNLCETTERGFSWESLKPRKTKEGGQIKFA
jgi:hypothetical protein